MGSGIFVGINVSVSTLLSGKKAEHENLVVHDHRDLAMCMCTTTMKIAADVI